MTDHLVISRVLGVIPPDGSNSLTIDLVPETIIERNSGFLDLRTLLLAFAAMNDRVNKELGRSSVTPDLRERVLLPLSVHIAKHAALALQIPELFSLVSIPSSRGSVLLQMALSNEYQVIFLARTLDAILLEDSLNECVMEIVSLISEEVVKKRGFDISENGAASELNLLTNLFGQMREASKLGVLVASTRNFLPNSKSGFALARFSFLGALSLPNCCDHSLMYGTPEYGKSVKSLYFQDLDRKSLGELNAAFNLLRSQENQVIDVFLSIVNPLLKGGEISRKCVLNWIGACLSSSSARATLNWQQQNAPPPYNLYEHLKESPQLGGSLSKFRAILALQGIKMGGGMPTGFALHLFWSLIELCLPLKIANAGGVSVNALTSRDPGFMSLAKGLLDEARMAPKERVLEIEGKDGKLAIPPFKDQIFWLTVFGLHTLLLPTTKEVETALGVASLSHRDNRTDTMVDAYGEFHTLQVIVENNRFIAGLGHFLNLVLVVILKAALECESSTPGQPPATPFLGLDVLSGPSSVDDLPNGLAILPACLIDDVVEALAFYRTLSEATRSSSESLLGLLDADLYLIFTIWTLSSDTIKNPNTRGKAAKVLRDLLKETRFAHRIETAQFSVKNVIPACIRVFTAVEKTRQSYYDIRMHIKFELRIPIQQLFERVLALPEHRKSLEKFARDRSDEFTKFINQLLNDTTYLLDEGLDTLINIRKGKTGPIGGNRQETEDVAESSEQQPAAEGENEPSRSMQDPKEHCKTYMQMGRQTMSTLHQICKEACSTISDNRVVLDQLVTSCLDPCLDRLVGPRCLELKGETRDFELYNFDPKETLSRICEIYVFLADSGLEKLARVIADDDRYYRPETFRKTVAIARREGLLTAAMLTKFETFVKFLNETATERKNALDSVVIPDEFLDPLMAEIMADPVLLPSSNVIMDRRHILRIILSDDHDPFNRTHLKVEDLIPQVELKTKIREWCSANNIGIDQSE